MKAFDPFPWKYLEDSLAQGFEAHWPTVLKMLKDEYADQVVPCPECKTPAKDLTWIPVLTCDESWEDQQGAVGYLTVCLPCRHQVDFLLEEISTGIEAETRAETGASTFGITWRRDGEKVEMPDITLSLLVLKSHQVESLKKFYETIGIEFTAEKHGTGPAHFSASLDGTLLEIYPLHDDEAADKTTRIGFTVEDIGLVLESLHQLGLSPQTEAKQSEWGLRAVVKDPDGRSVELCQQHE